MIRMMHWLLLAAVFYAVAQLLTALGMQPQIQVVLWKCGHVTLGAYLGYWIDRNAFRSRVREFSEPLLHLRRAIIMVGAMYTLGTGL